MSESLRSINVDITELIDEEDKIWIDETMEDATIVFDIFKKLGIEKKSTSYQTLHKYGYENAKDKCPYLNTAILQASAKEPLIALKSWNTKHKKAKWQYNGKKNGTEYPLNLRSLSRRGNLTTFSSNGGRIRVMHELPVWFEKSYPDKTLQSGHVLKIKDHNKVKYILSLTYKIPSIEFKTTGKVVGIDLGLYHIIATSEGFLQDSKHIHSVERKYSFLKSALQSKGTRSAKRHLRKLSGREKRFKLDVDHCLSKQLANDSDVKAYVFEDLTGITETKRSRKLNRWLHKWAFHRLFTFTKYKCESKGIQVETVPPNFTSQECSVCHHTEKDNRYKNKYVCLNCGHTDHADLNAAKVIRNRFLLTPVGKSGRIQPSNRVNHPLVKK